MMRNKKIKLVSLMVIPFLALSMTTASIQVQAQEVKPPVQDGPVSVDVVKAAMENQAKTGFAPVDYAKVNFSPDAPYFEGIYPIDPATMIQAECGGKYLDEECFVRVGVPIPPNVAFTAVDEKGQPTFRGVRPPSAEQMKDPTNLAPNSFPTSKVPDGLSKVEGRPGQPDQPGVSAYYGDWRHEQQGWLLGPLAAPNLGVFATNSSPNWNMPGWWWPYYLYQTMYPGNSCIESGMLHQMYNSVVSHGHVMYNHCASATPNYSQDWFAYEIHNAAWISTYERWIMGGSSYQEYIYVYAPQGGHIPNWESCAQSVMYNYLVGHWEQKMQICGWNNQIVQGDGWNLVEWYNLWNSSSGKNECWNHPSVVWMSNSVYFVNYNITWEAVGYRGAKTDEVNPPCTAANFGDTWDWQHVRGWIFY